MSHVNDPGNTTEDAFVVASTTAGQHALWQDSGIDLPAGWQRRSAVMSRSACLDAIAAAWPDITPARQPRPGPAGPTGPARGGAMLALGHEARFVHERFAEQAVPPARTRSRSSPRERG